MDKVQSSFGLSENNDSSLKNNRFLNFFPSSKSFIVFILIVLIMAGIASYSLSQRGKEKIPVPPPSPSKVPEISSEMIVYGVWKDNKSFIKGHLARQSKEYAIATLPINIKKITVLSGTELLYISETNDKDHGRNLSTYDLLTGKSKIAYNASDNFGIDDYVISKDKRHVAIWEVSFNPQSKALLNGRSRVIAIDLKNPSLKNIVYNETAEKAVHYPRAILSSGEIFLDTFLPNSGAGWAYGMSVSSFDGAQKQDLENMKNGTYGTQPDISPDEQYLVFSGYSGKDGQTSENGVRKALMSPDTVELINTRTLERTKLENIPANNIYPFSYFDQASGNPVFFEITNDKNPGIYSYNLNSNISLKINTRQTGNFIAFITKDYILTGQKSATISSLGNLGNDYSSTFNNFSVLNLLTNQTTLLNLPDSFMQYISIVPSGFFKNIDELDVNPDKTLQLQTFNFKPSLAPVRQKQQTEPVNPEPTGVPCQGTRFSQCSKKYTNGTQEFSDCLGEQTRYACYDSPLYLYGLSGTKVNIKINSYVYSSDPEYDKNAGYGVRILDNGKMEVSGKIYERLNYDYLSEKVTPPNYGTVTSKEKLSETLRFYGRHLGLNIKETNDLVDYGVKNINSSYIFVSFFDDKISKEILPLEFTPKPDTYINIVFYFKELDNSGFSTAPPIFPKIPERTGLAAVEISSIFDR
ncbi:MAG: hypothetical protein Q7K55_01980 [Candidatus Levybacteria bacterium]|nr:hypothetical protein [Candidatus Levybacteria bacterium]